MRRWVIGICIAMAGCRAAAPVSPSASSVVLLGPQLQRQDAQLVGQHFRTLLDFEHDADTAFVRGPSRATADGHTGLRSLRAGSPVSVNVGSILFGTVLPADWTLLGGYVRVRQAGRVAATLLADGKAVGHGDRELPAGVWGFVAVDLTRLDDRAALAVARRLELRFDGGDGLDLDDVLLVDNRRILAGGDWSVVQAGLAISIIVPGRPPIDVPSTGPAAWSVEEANVLRLRLRDAAGLHGWTLEPDGRSIKDGHIDGVGPATDAHLSPATITLDEAAGRIDREVPGDVDNDGYDEARGAYQIVAKRPRLTLTIHPGAAPAVSPMLEIRGLPPGPVSVIAAGRLIDRTARLDDGTVLVLLPVRLETATEVTVSASGN